jgi:hypothetical protein
MSIQKFNIDKYPSLALIDATLRANHRFASGSVDRCIALFGERGQRSLSKLLALYYQILKCWLQQSKVMLTLRCNR